MLKNPFFKSTVFFIIISIFLGAFAGVIFGSSCASLGEIGKLFIMLIKTIAAPLLFFSIIHTVATSEIKMKDGVRMIVVAVINAAIALTIALTLTNFVKPGHYMKLADSAAVSENNSTLKLATEVAHQKFDATRFFATLVPKSIVEPFAENAMITIVLMAIFLGVAIKRTNHEHPALLDATEGMLKVTQVILSWIIHFSPIAVFAVVAKSVGEYGFAPVKGLAFYLLVGMSGLLIHILVTYQLWIAVFAKMSLKKFWTEARDAVSFSFGANSSLATLPLTLKTLDRLKVKKSAASLGACIGTNLNNDGIVLYEAMAALFIAQASGIDLSLSQQIMMAGMCLIAAMGITGVPEAGIISLAVVLGAVGLPVELLPILLTVDWIIARMRSVTNVLSDMVTSIILDRLM